MPETYIIDTNVFLFDPEALEHFPDANVLVPMEVIEELDKFKHDSNETGRNARQTAHVIDALREQGYAEDVLDDGVAFVTSLVGRTLRNTAIAT